MRNRSAAFGRLCVETESHTRNGNTPPSAAFGRLCVETSKGCTPPVRAKQPPSGGCVLKPVQFIWAGLDDDQPPSGGCVLKPPAHCWPLPPTTTAAFGRLCVETRWSRATKCAVRCQPPSGGCVLKQAVYVYGTREARPAAFGRLCVETANTESCTGRCGTSRLRAAVC